jgi:3-oxoacyl-[acyl-carrier-protein] synthase III
MAIIKYDNIGISAIAACVPPKIFSNYDLGYMVPDDAIEKLIKSIGIKERRIAEPEVCSSDLCYEAAEKLLSDNRIDRSSIDMLIFLTMTPDYITPPTSSILQSRLGLSTGTACFDMSLACSGFVYALATGFAFASSNGIERVLVLVGETMSKLANPKDRVNFPLYGDAGTACLIEKGDYGESFFLLSGDGGGENTVKVPHGGFRHPFSADSFLEKEREEGNYRREVDITMDGIGTFNHAVSAIPKQVKKLMQEASITAEDVDYLVSHQANKFMIDFIVKRLKFDPNKVPFCLEKYGNTSAASIPLTIVSELEHKLEGRKRLLLSAIGAGWSLGTAFMQTENISISGIAEYGGIE